MFSDHIVYHIFFIHQSLRFGAWKRNYDLSSLHQLLRICERSKRKKMVWNNLSGYRLCFKDISGYIQLFLFFENGFENIGQLYENVKEQTAIYGMSFSVYRFGIIPLFLQLGKTLNIENQFILYETGKYLTYILGLLSTGLFFTTKSSLIRFGLAAMICVLVPQQAFVYNGIYIFPLLIMLLSANSKLSSIETCLTLFLFIWILLPVQLNKFTPKINNISMILMWVLFISIAIRQYLLNKKNNLNSSSKER